MIDRPMHRRNQTTKKPVTSVNSVKARKWEKLIGWSVKPDCDTYNIGIEAWSKRRYKESTSGNSVEYLCSNDHFCNGILDWESFIDDSLEKQEERKVDNAVEKSDCNGNLKLEELSEKNGTDLEKSIIKVDKYTRNETYSNNVEQNTVEATAFIDNPSRKTYFKEENHKETNKKTNYVKVRPISSNSLPEKKQTRMQPKRHVLSANDTYLDVQLDISAVTNKIKFSYTKKEEPKLGTNVSTDNNNHVNDIVSNYNLDHLQLHKKYVLPNSANVSIGDLLHSHPRIERNYANERDIVFTALANENGDASKNTTHSLPDNQTCIQLSPGLPPVNQNHKSSNSGNEIKNVASMPRIPLLPQKTSKSADETLIKQMNDPKEETTHSFTSLSGYATYSRSNDIDANYIPKHRGPPAFRAATNKTPLHRAIESAHKKLHGPHHRLLSKSNSRLSDNVAAETSVEQRRWSSSLPKSKKQAEIAPNVNNTVAWKQELESHIRYQRSTLSRRKKTQLRIGDKLYSVQSAGTSHTRINVER
ncbi:uncharacterized protein [Antedon mediterranea]|uniref:uncharacterized protein n=1 Tax=Antedon mediterranea TaxID=105859 RepID=UPI003AF80C66